MEFGHSGVPIPVDLPFMGGIARQNKMKAIEIGGIEDQVHLLLSLPATLSIAKAAQLIKGGSTDFSNGRKNMGRST